MFLTAYNGGFDGSKAKGMAARFKPDSSSEHDSSWTSFDNSASKGSEVGNVVHRYGVFLWG